MSYLNCDTDSCGNVGIDVTQKITVKDIAPPDLPDQLDDIVLLCPSDFKANELVAPNATGMSAVNVYYIVLPLCVYMCFVLNLCFCRPDDCETEIMVESTIPSELDRACKDSFHIIWTAFDGCSKEDQVSQAVVFEGIAQPTINCPENPKVTGGSSTLSHIVDYGQCYSESDVTMTVEASCKDCDDADCAGFSFSTDGTDLSITAPEFSTVEWTATLTYDCGSVSVTCSAESVASGETMFGEPYGETKKLVSDVDNGANRWGWYQEFEFAEPGIHNFRMHAGAGRSDLTKGFSVGDVSVYVADCASGEESSADWSALPFQGICVDHPDEEHHLHVGLSLPEKGNGDITMGPGSFSAGCCNLGETCFVAVHGVVAEAKCDRGDGCVF